MDFVRIATVTGSHGLDGTIKIAPHTDNPHIFAEMEYLMIASNGAVKGSYEIIFMQEHSGSLLVQVKGIDTKEKAHALKGFDVVISADILPEEDDGDIYWYRIENAEVVDESGEYIGRLTDYMETGSNDVFIITNGDKSYMISNNEQHVLKIDAAAKRIIIDKAGLVSEEI